MDKTQQNFAVMFADVAKSTQLYEQLGDNVANKMISDAIQLASDIVKEHQGIVVKTIGDEIMCRFSDTDQAILCACTIHEVIENQPIKHGVGLSFRIGLHWGPALLQDDGDIFGDAVNLAARMAGVAKARQTITTDITQNRLSSTQLLSKCREIDRIHVKGKAEPVSIIEVMWEPDDITRMSTAISNSVATVNNNTLIIIYQKNKRTLHTGMPAYTFGRDAQCDQVVDSSLVSRVHAKIENRRGKFLLIDESTNGSYIKNGSNHSLFLRREEVILNGEGVISFGEEIDSNSQFLLQFNLPG